MNLFEGYRDFAATSDSASVVILHEPGPGANYTASSAVAIKSSTSCRFNQWTSLTDWIMAGVQNSTLCCFAIAGG